MTMKQRRATGLNIKEKKRGREAAALALGGQKGEYSSCRVLGFGAKPHAWTALFTYSESKNR